VRAIQLERSLPAPLLVRTNAAQPHPGPGETLIRVHAAAVTPSELAWYPTTHTKSGGLRVGAIPGHEFSGEIVSAENGGAMEPGGLEVYGMNDWFAEGAMAEYCVAPLGAISPKPRGLSYAQAASVPISALTAWQGLFHRARLQAGERVLVHGGSGAVGAYVVQLARMHGAHVIATASGDGLAFVRELGAEQVIDYRNSRFEEVVSGMDVVFDTVGGETLRRSWSVLGPRGRMVTIAAGEEGTADSRVKEAFFIVEPDRDQLAAISGRLEGGQLRPFVDAVIPLSQAAEAYAGKLPRQHRGKVVVSIVNNN
jgi:NADPH:quinone reductase-like Zn-dependent oxidoreductase